MKKPLLLIPLMIGYAAAAATYPAFPVYDPFTDATASGGSSYAVGATLAGQTNAMGQYWYGINTSASAANAIKVTTTSVAYNNLPGFSAKAVMLTNVSGPGARIFFQQSAPLNIGSNYYYSVVMVASNINNLSSTTGQEVLGFGTQGTIANQTTQPAQGSALWLKQVGTGPNFNFQLGLTPSGSPGTATFDTANTYSTGTVYLVVVAVEAGDIARLWVNPDPSTFGAAAEPTATFSSGAGSLQLSSFTCVQMFDIANAANDLYVGAFRLGTSWEWVTGGPAIGLQPVPATNCPGGVVNLTVSSMLNGTANGYQWQFNGVNLTDGPSVSGSGATVSGSATASLTISGMDTSAAQRDSGSYTVVVTNAYGAVTSSVAAVSAHSVPAFTTQPLASVRLYAGASGSLSVTAVGFAPLSYYWYSNSTLIPAVTSSNFPIANAQANASFYCVVSNAVGTVTSSVAGLTVVSPPTFPYPATVFNDHPIGFWPLEEIPDNSAGNNGTTAYDYAGGNNGFYTNVTLGQTGYGTGLATQYGYAPATDTNSSVLFGSFSSVNSYVAQIPNINFAASTASSFSVEAWLNANFGPEPSGAGIVSKGYGNGGEQFALDYSGTGWRFSARSAAGVQVAAAGTNSIDGNSHHLAGVVDTVHSNITIYVDGQARAVAPFNPATGILSSAYPVVIGSRTSALSSSDLNDNFLGDIQEVALYNYALTAAQVANHYYAAGIGPSVTLPTSVTVNEGATLVVPATFAGSPPLALQWYDVTSGPPGTALAGQTNASLIISNISAVSYDSHYVALTVTNVYGQATSISPLFIQVLSGAPNSVVIAPPVLSVYGGSSLPVPFTVTAQGSEPFSYQWSTNGVAVPGATNSFYTNVPPLPGTYTIGCQVTNRFGAAPLATASLVVAALPGDFYAATVLRAGPVAFWRLDEPANATTAYDYIGSHNATYNNAINGQPGFSPIIIPQETATLFGNNGISPSMAMEDNNSANGLPVVDFATQGGNAEFSVELWVQAPAVPGGADLICKGFPNNTQFAIDQSGTAGSFRFVLHSSSGTIFNINSGSVVPDGKWHHLVGVCDEANNIMRFYADGSQKSSVAVPSGSGVLALPSSYPVVIAAQQNQNHVSFTSVTNTTIAQVALYNYALPASQVVSNFFAASFVQLTISAALSGTSLVLTYTGTLVSGTNAAGPINNVVAGATSPYTVPATNAQMFFRSRAVP
jgi:hypothetical protein